MTSEQTLTEQERREADGLIALWQRIKEEELADNKTRHDIEERLLSCYGKSRDTARAIAKKFQSVVCGNLQIDVGLRRLHDKVRDYLVTQGPDRGTEPAPWFSQEFNKLCVQVKTAMGQNREVAAIADLMVAGLHFCPQSVTSFIGFFAGCRQKIEDIADSWQKTQKETRQMLERVNGLARMWSVVAGLLETWASGSSARTAYLQEAGIYIAPAVAAPAFSPAVSSTTISRPPQSLRRKKVEKAREAADSAKEPAKETPAEARWQVCCFNPTGTLVDSFPMLLSDNGDQLAGKLDQLYSWPHNGPRTMRRLRRLVSSLERIRTKGTTGSAYGLGV